MAEKILITGVCGFVGQNLYSHLKGCGYEVSGVDIAPCFKGDNARLLDITRPVTTLPDYDIMIHLAGNADTGLSFKNPMYDFRSNVVGTMNLLEYNRTHGNKPVIFASSYRVYPMPESQINKYRTDSEGVRSVYGCSKLACENYLMEYHHLFGMPVVVNRLSCVFGEKQKPNKQGWITLFIHSKLNGLPIEVSGDGKQIRDCLYIGDLNRLIELEIKNMDRCSGNVYDIGGGPKNAFSLLEIIDFLDMEFPEDAPLEIEWVPEGRSFRAYISDISKISWLWKPEISVQDGIRRTARWLHDA